MPEEDPDHASRVHELISRSTSNFCDCVLAADVVALARETLLSGRHRLWGLMTCMLEEFSSRVEELEDELAATDEKLTRSRARCHEQRQQIEILEGKIYQLTTAKEAEHA